MLKQVTNAFKSSNFRQTFNFGEEISLGRSCMLVSNMINAGIIAITTGTFYTGFLIANDISLVNTGILAFVPFISVIVTSLIAPYILSKFQRRRTFLLTLRLMYHVINILGITTLPYFVKDNNTKLLFFIIFAFLSSGLSTIDSAGFSEWHLKYIPNEVRTEYFSYLQIFSSIISGVMWFVSGIVTDNLNGTPYEATVLFAIRYFAFALAIVQLFFLAKPKEVSYIQRATPKLRNILTLPFSKKKFMLTMLIIFLWTFFQFTTSSSLIYYLLNSVGVKYTFIASIDASYALFLIFFSAFWKKIVRKYSWFKTFAISAILHAPTTFLYSFVSSSNYIVVMLIVRLTQHFLGVGLNLSYANFAFINLPEEDKSTYISFYTLVVNLASLLGTALATLFIDLTPNLAFNFLGHTFTSVPALVLFHAFGQAFVALLIFKLMPKIIPD